MKKLRARKNKMLVQDVPPFFWPTAGTYKDETRCGNGFHRAAEKIRTFTAFRPLPPQSSASTSFATAARAANLIIVRIVKNDLQNNVLNPEL